MLMQNPFSLAFGKEPQNLIRRELQNEEIISSFTADNPGYQVCMITGVRGAGKTVEMTTIANRISGYNDWIVINLNPERDLLQMWAAELSNRRDLLELFRDAKINLSVLGLGLEIDGVPPITDVVVALRCMLEKLTARGKRILVTVDEVTVNRHFKEFASQFQIFIREGLSVFLLMTGLYENIDLIQNEKSLTFLYRAPKVELMPLNTGLMAAVYREVFSLTPDDAMSMANLTMGYPFAFQLLGYLCWNRQKHWRDILLEFDNYLWEYSYEKIWSECSDVDRKILAVIASDSEPVRVDDIRSEVKMSSSLFSVYRKRLLKKGIVKSPSYGKLCFTLPRFGVFIYENRNGDYDEELLEDLINRGFSGQELLSSFKEERRKLRHEADKEIY